ncbi:class I SAM-dependent methyltransferase [Luteimonas sp. A537]
MKNPTADIPTALSSPFGGKAALLQEVPTGFIVEHYRRKCGIDVSRQFGSLGSIGLYECAETGYRFWRPEEVAGDEDFYREISRAWKNYYRAERWEYSHVRNSLTGTEHLLEIGCGRGYFLRSLEGGVKSATGLEFNEDAIREKVTSADVLHTSIEDIATKGGRFDIVCAFHVLEHVTDPRFFIEQALACLNDHGTLIFSTPNNDNIDFRNQQDIFDAPPHHMGHFTAAAYENIARLFGCTISKAVIQPRNATLPATTHGTSRSTLNRAANFVARSLMTVSYRINKEPGETLLVFLRKGGCA